MFFQEKKERNIQSLLLSYLFIAPEKYYGFSLGGLGLALSVLITQIVYTNLLLAFISHKLSINFVSLFIHHIVVIVLLISLSVCLKYFAINLFGDSMIVFIANGFFYLLIVSILIYLFPALIFYSKKKLHIVLKKTINKNLKKIT